MIVNSRSRAESISAATAAAEQQHTTTTTTRQRGTQREHACGTAEHVFWVCIIHNNVLAKAAIAHQVLTVFG